MNCIFIILLPSRYIKNENRLRYRHTRVSITISHKFQSNIWWTTVVLPRGAIKFPNRNVISKKQYVAFIRMSAFPIKCFLFSTPCFILYWLCNHIPPTSSHAMHGYRVYTIDLQIFHTHHTQCPLWNGNINKQQNPILDIHNILVTTEMTNVNYWIHKKANWIIKDSEETGKKCLKIKCIARNFTFDYVPLWFPTAYTNSVHKIREVGCSEYSATRYISSNDRQRNRAVVVLDWIIHQNTHTLLNLVKIYPRTKQRQRSQHTFFHFGLLLQRPG